MKNKGSLTAVDRIEKAQILADLLEKAQILANELTCNDEFGILLVSNFRIGHIIMRARHQVLKYRKKTQSVGVIQK